MIARAPDRAAPPAAPIDGTGATNREPLQPAGERRRRVCFDDEVQMVGLHGELDDAERVAAGLGERAAKVGEDPIGSE
jgi:hypothetical protein